MRIKSHASRIPYQPIALGILVAALLVGVGYYLISQAQNSYAGSVKDYAKDYDQILTTANKSIKEAGHDTAAVKISLQTAEKAISKQQKPEPTKLLGLSLQRQIDADKAKALNQTGKSLQQQLQKSITFIEYQQQIIMLVEPLKDTKTANADELRAAIGKWEEANGKMNAVKPPQELEAFHKDLSEQIAAVAAEMKLLPGLYDKQDVAGFAAQRQKVSGAMQAMRDDNTQLNAVLQAQDTALGEAAGKLRLNSR